jgi:hypothetical protein
MSLKTKIAAALADNHIASTDLMALIGDVETGVREAEENAAKARNDALDPAAAIGVAKAGAAVVTAELRRDRLKAALPRLQEHYQQVDAWERKEAWDAAAEAMERRRIALGREFQEHYEPAITQIVDTLRRMRSLDREIDELNGRKPHSGPGISYITPAFTVDLHVPDPEHKGLELWPPQKPTLAQQWAGAGNPYEKFGGVDWHEEVEKRDREVLAQNRRQIAEAERRQVEREAKEAADARAMKEAEAAAYAARHPDWPA